jgi:predicted TPR repeat methyltransferase
MYTALELMNLGWQHHQAGEFAQAEQLYRQVLQLEPWHADALYLLGAALQTLGKVDEALDNYEKALQVRPDYAEIYHNLGVAKSSQGKLEEAIAHFRHAIQLKPDFASAHYSLGIDLAKLGRANEAIASYYEAIRLRPGHVDAYNSSGSAWRTLGRLDHAASCFQQALHIQPDSVETHNNLGVVLREQGRLAEALLQFQTALALRAVDASTHLNLGDTFRELSRYAEAAASYEEALRLQPDNEQAKFYHAILTGGPTPKTAPGGSVRWLFDNYAERFDKELVERLQYRGPQLLRAAVGYIPANQSLAVLDLGCGTGLCGPLFRDLARTLTGVDLSPAMLAQARKRGVYDELVENDIATFLLSSTAQYDLIISGDVFIYVGDLVDVFAGARRVLRLGGRFVFTVEADPGEEFVALPSGRFAHSLTYLRRLAMKNSLEERSVEQAVLRKEYSGEAKGMVVVFQRAAP